VAGPKKGRWFDHAKNVGGGPLELIIHIRGGTQPEAFEWLRSIGVPAPERKQSRYRVAEYIYRDRSGQSRFKVVRWGPCKTFSQERFDPASGDFISGKGCMKRVELIPYRLDEWTGQAGLVLIPEGEKNCDNLWVLGLMATCNAGGAEKWKDGYGRWFAASHTVVILPDNDDPGRRLARQVARSLMKTPVCGIKVLELPGLAEKGDVSDWVTAGGTKDQLIELVKHAPEAKDWLASEAEEPVNEHHERRDKTKPDRELAARRLLRWAAKAYKRDSIEVADLFGERIKRAAARCRASQPKELAEIVAILKAAGRLRDWQRGVRHKFDVSKRDAVGVTYRSAAGGLYRVKLTADAPSRSSWRTSPR
jgi:hypothetical protein